ncbi:NAD(P)H-binding protein [Phototrophicus methaneseepsis]|uniref:NAD(P)H-binding protein n=1 Tax=Phototrophicus methaneseepsis TaxID=2710758 RepID=A0A7S8IFK8_9CHLR|nr:NAD(P)H-binding protein [Phototrophicus methaneseepsis]QPC84840.1 NAD(P)H-binding protein [Phototrophicus methaneseepsis]
MAVSNPKRVVVTGGGTFLGISIASALLAEGAEVTLILRPGNEKKLGPLASRVRWHVADMWDPASLRGRSRGHGVLIHTVGSMTADPARGLTYHRLNFLSARNAANMCISDGVPHMVLLSAASAPWINRQYVKAKREAEAYLRRVGIQSSVIRAPLTYVRGQQRPLFYQAISTLGAIPIVNLFGLRYVAPIPLDLAARGIARIALSPTHTRTIYTAVDLRRLNKREELQGTLPSMRAFDETLTEAPESPYAHLDEDTPFGWMPESGDKPSGGGVR